MPRTPRISIFLSSTRDDLIEHRLKLRDEMLKLGFFPIMMENFLADGHYPVDVCLSKVDEADIYVGVIAHRYGSCPPGCDISFTETEFNRAGRNRIPRLCFLVEDNFPWSDKYIEGEPGKSKLDAFKTRIKSKGICPTFSTPDSLASEVLLALQTVSWKRLLKQQQPMSNPQHQNTSRKSIEAEAYVEAIISKRIRGF